MIKNNFLYKSLIRFRRLIKDLIISNVFKLNFFFIRQVEKSNYLIFFKKQNIIKIISYLYLFDIFLTIANFYFKKKPLIFKKVSFFFRLKNTTWTFYKPKNLFNLLFKNKNFGLIHSWKWLSSWVLSIFIFFLYVYYLSYLKVLIIQKSIFVWFLFTMFIYWLMSGFVFFIKKYQFSKFTSVTQRFWKRTYILFWLIESGVFIIFFFLTLNASSEPTYMYDAIKVYKSRLFSWRSFIEKLFFPLTLIFLSSYLKNWLKWNLFSKQIIILTLITLILLYIVWLEFYQFYHIINYYNTYIWKFKDKDFLWVLNKEVKRTRIVNNYVTICLLAKFWHLIFIFIFWIFFILRVNELNRLRYLFLSANQNNFIILYIMTWLYMYPWFKFSFRSILNIPFYWFLINTRRNYFRVFFNDLKLFFYALSNLSFFNLKQYSLINFFYINKACYQVGYLQFKKHYLKDLIFLTL